MTTILFTFVAATLIALLLTPVASRLGMLWGAVDKPSARKVHLTTIPRSGGPAIFVSFFLALIAARLLNTQVSELMVWDSKVVFAMLGGVVIFSVGLIDDFRRLGPKSKLIMQIFAASLAFYGGVRIDVFAIGGTTLNFGIFSYPITVFWFLLFINALNLIDGLDGLAAGVSLFASLMMVFLSVIQANYLSALEFAALAGALLGFLRYNFNPASIFMGDGGSYFIGYAIAALAILGSLKSQVGATLLIPLLALGVPIFDTILSPLRRFLKGRRMFQPDKDHIHHRLLEMGLSTRNAVLIIYAATAVLCFLAILVVNIRNKTAGLLLLIPAIAVFVIVRKFGYFEYLATDKIAGWFRDMSDEAGISQGRRSFLSLQVEMDKSRDLDELWQDVCEALEMLHFDRGELHVCRVESLPGAGVDVKIPPGADVKIVPDVSLKIPLGPPFAKGEDFVGGNYCGEERRKANNGQNGCGTKCFQLLEQQGDKIVRIWTRGHYRRETDVSPANMFRVELPVGAGALFSLNCRLVLIKDLQREPLEPYTLRRVEHLRRSLTDAIQRLSKK